MDKKRTTQYNIDIKTPKLFISTGSFHVNSNIDKLYSNRKGGRGLSSLVDTYISRLVSTNSNLMEKSPSNTYLALVFNYEKKSLVRVVNQFVQCFDILVELNEPTKNLSFKI